MAKPDFLKMMKGDGVDAAYRVGANQMVRGLQGAVVKVVESQGGKSETVKAASELLDSEFGKSVLGYTAGLALTYAPVISEDERAKRLAEEFRVGGMATAGNAIIDNLMATILPILQETLSHLPEAEGSADESEQVRIAALPDAVNMEDAAPTKKATAR